MAKFTKDDMLTISKLLFKLNTNKNLFRIIQWYASELTGFTKKNQDNSNQFKLLIYFKKYNYTEEQDRSRTKSKEDDGRKRSPKVWDFLNRSPEFSKSIFTLDAHIKTSLQTAKAKNKGTNTKPSSNKSAPKF